MNFGQRLLRLRKTKGISQEELGGELKVSRQTISKWELGETTPEMDKLLALSEYFDISLDVLVKGEEVYNPNSFQEDKINENKINQDKHKRTLYEVIILVVKIVGILVLADIIMMVIYFSLNGFPPL